MIKNNFKRFACAAALSIGAGSAFAEDIDIYSMRTSATAGAPNVLIVMDNTANWGQSFGSGSKFSAQLAALSTVVGALKTQFNLGLMMFTESGGGNTGNDGGYVRFAIQGMTDSSGNASVARNCLLKMVGSGSTCTSLNPYYSLIDIGNDKSNNGKAGMAMAEVYDYFAGLNAYAGNYKVKADPLAFTSGLVAGPQYQTPVTVSCQKNYIIYLSNGPVGDVSSDTVTATALLNTAGGPGSTTVINPPDDGSSRNNVADEWTRFLNKISTVEAVTYTLEVGPDTTEQGRYNTALLQSMGRQGKGGYYSAIDSATLLAALTRIFNDINAKNSVFASSSLPLSSDNSGAFLNQVYMGLFRPDAGGGPRWLGNLKQYQFAVDVNNNLYLADKAGAAAASGDTGFAQPDAESFWTARDTSRAPDMAAAASTSATTGSTGGFWYFDSKGTGLTYDSVDGEWVEKGGAAQQLRLAHLGYGGRGGIGATNAATLNALPARQVFTCTGACLTSGTALSGTPFDTSNAAITNALLGTGSTTVSAIASASAKSVSALAAGVSKAIATISKTGGVGLVTTAAAHDLVVGDSVVIAGTGNQFDGTHAVLTRPSATSFTYAASNNNSATIGGTATKAVTTALATVTAHGFVVGQRVTVAGATPAAFRGVVTVASVVDADRFTYTLSSALGQVATGTITATSNTATATSTAHGLSTGDSVTIAGATPAGYNGLFVVTVVDANSFTYSYPTAAPLAASSGTITAAIGGGRATLINWVRGMDTQDENGFKVNGADTDVRASIHGDVLHSRPLVLNYGTAASNNIYIFYGGNDGAFRAVKGGQAATDGVEQWAFIPSEFFGKLKRQYNNSPGVAYPSTPTGLSPTPTPRDYFFDGPVGTYVERNASGTVTKAYLFIAMRRGGRTIYALDVTSPTNPKFLWRKSSADAGFTELAQTWSQPQVTKIRANVNPVLIFGGGYDAVSEDTDTPAATDSLGRAIYVLDAFTGAPLWAAGNNANFGTLPSGMTFFALDGRAATTSPVAPARGTMNFSVAADVLVIDRNQDGYADRLYATDVGGNVWRVDTDNADRAQWRVSKIAALGSRAAAASTRKFLFGADVVFGENFDSIVVGSGDREHPLVTSTAAYGVANRVYMIKDIYTGLNGASLALVDTCGTAVLDACSSFFDATLGAAVPASAVGWSITLATGEKVVNSPLVTAGHAIFGTNKPDLSGNSCTPNLGEARRYDINYLSGAPAGALRDANGNPVLSQLAIGGGFLPSPVSGVVEINGVRHVFTTDNPLNPGGVIPIEISVTNKRYRTYWKEKVDAQ